MEIAPWPLREDQIQIGRARRGQGGMTKAVKFDPAGKVKTNTTLFHYSQGGYVEPAAEKARPPVARTVDMGRSLSLVSGRVWAAAVPWSCGSPVTSIRFQKEALL